METAAQNQIDLDAFLEEQGFVKISAFPMEDFLVYQNNIRHSDLSYALLYAWEWESEDRIKRIHGNPVLAGYDMFDMPYFTVVPVVPENFLKTVQTMIDLFGTLGEDFTFQYITSECAALLTEQGFEVTYDLDYSDYIYDSKDFVNIYGKKNNSKRHEYYKITKKYPVHRYEEMCPENYKDIFQIFDSWCANRSCEDCIWGCEKAAFLRLFEVVRRKPQNFYGGIVYLNQIPMSFGLAEKLNNEMVCYHTQKNAVRVNGLTYYLHHHMALKHLDIPYINWGEDMGVAGLRNNKRKYHPCYMEHKYEIKFRCTPCI